jgi:hypothetical protein
VRRQHQQPREKAGTRMPSSTPGIGPSGDSAHQPIRRVVEQPE